MVKVVIYSTPTCSYCQSAKALLKRKGVEYQEIAVDKDETKRREMVEQSGGMQTVPQIFIDDEHIGGYDDLTALDRQGLLDKKLGLTK